MHQERWFSDGAPTALVRDGLVESRDDPPEPAWSGPLSELPHEERPAARYASLGEVASPDNFSEKAPPDITTAVGRMLWWRKKFDDTDWSGDLYPR